MTSLTGNSGISWHRFRVPEDLERRLQQDYAVDREYLEQSGNWWYVRLSTAAEREDDELTSFFAGPGLGNKFTLVIDSPSRTHTVRLLHDDPLTVAQLSRILGVSKEGAAIVLASTDEEFEALFNRGGRS